MRNLDLLAVGGLGGGEAGQKVQQPPQLYVRAQPAAQLCIVCIKWLRRTSMQMDSDSAVQSTKPAQLHVRAQPDAQLFVKA